MEPPAGAALGEHVVFDSVKYAPDLPAINGKHINNVWKKLRTDENKVVHFGRAAFKLSTGLVVAPTIANGTVA